MTMMDVIPFGPGELLIQLFAIPVIPDDIGFGRYYEGKCKISLNDNGALIHDCIIFRPKNNRNVLGNRTPDMLLIWMKIDITRTQLLSANFALEEYGPELSEREAKARSSRELGSQLQDPEP